MKRVQVLRCSAMIRHGWALLFVISTLCSPAWAHPPNLLGPLLSPHTAVVLLIRPETGQIVDANAAASAFYGYAHETLCQMNIQQINLLSPEELAREMAKVKAARRNYFVFPHKLADGQVRTVEVYSAPVTVSESPGKPGEKLLLSILHDVTERPLTEHARREYQERLTRLVGERTQQLEDANRQTQRLLLGGLALTLGLNILLGLVVYRLRRALAALAFESTRRTSLATQLEQSNAELQRFAEVSAHHLKEPARRLGTYAERLESLLKDCTLDEEAQLSLHIIRAQATRQQALLRDVELYLSAHLPLGPVGLQDVGKVLSDVLNRLQPELTAHQTQVSVSELPSAWIDPPRLTTLLTQLLENALRHARRDTSQAETDTVPAAPSTASVLEPSAAPGLVLRMEGTRLSPGMSQFSLSDNGPGIAPEYRERVFRVFEQLGTSSGPAGTGVGLAIVRRIVESSGGRIWIEASALGGCRVVFTLPGRSLS